jgi:hypothetical protein
MPAIVNKLGPGTLTVGETGTEVDFTCQVTAARVEWSADAEDDVQVLCGESVPGARTYSATLSATILNDLGTTAGIVEFSWTNKGATYPFVFQPSMTAGVKQVSGEVIIDPISVGGDEVGQNMTSDFEWACVGDPILETAAVTGVEAPTARRTSTSNSTATAAA